MDRDNRGFTLLELLTVITIVSLIANTVVASMYTAQVRARDAKRLHDLATIRNALNLFYDEHGYYPEIPPGTGTKAVVLSTATGGDRDWSILGDQLLPYIDPLPVDPVNVGGNTLYNRFPGQYAYFYTNCPESEGGPFGGCQNAISDNQTYDLIARLELDNPNMCKYKDWKVQSFDHYGADVSINNSWCDLNYPGGGAYAWGDSGYYIVADH